MQARDTAAPVMIASVPLLLAWKGWRARVEVGCTRAAELDVVVRKVRGEQDKGSSLVLRVVIRSSGAPGLDGWSAAEAIALATSCPSLTVRTSRYVSSYYD